MGFLSVFPCTRAADRTKSEDQNVRGQRAVFGAFGEAGGDGVRLCRGQDFLFGARHAQESPLPELPGFFET